MTEIQDQTFLVVVAPNYRKLTKHSSKQIYIHGQNCIYFLMLHQICFINGHWDMLVILNHLRTNLFTTLVSQERTANFTGCSISPVLQLKTVNSGGCVFFFFFQQVKKIVMYPIEHNARRFSLISVWQISRCVAFQIPHKVTPTKDRYQTRERAFEMKTRRARGYDPML